MQNNKQRFKIYNWLNRDGSGIKPEDVVTSTNLRGFFYRYKISFSKLLSINILYVLGNFFLIFLILTFAGVTKIDYFRPSQDVFALQNGIIIANGGAQNALDFSLFTTNAQQILSSANTPLTYVFWILASLTLLTWGCVNAGATYLTRNLVMGEPVFTFSDFWYCVKKNWKQALPFGIFDAIICILIPCNIYIMLISSGDYLSSLVLWMNIALFFIYTFMRFYIYVQMVSFNLSIKKILKHSFAFSILGWKRNFMALFGIVLLLILEYLFLILGGGILLPLAVGFPLMLLFSHALFMKTYASFFVIKRYMIDEDSQDACGDAHTP